MERNDLQGGIYIYTLHVYIHIYNCATIITFIMEKPHSSPKGFKKKHTSLSLILDCHQVHLQGVQEQSKGLQGQTQVRLHSEPAPAPSRLGSANMFPIVTGRQHSTSQVFDL